MRWCIVLVPLHAVKLAAAAEGKVAAWTASDNRTTEENATDVATDAAVIDARLEAIRDDYDDAWKNATAPGGDFETWWLSQTWVKDLTKDINEVNSTVMDLTSETKEVVNNGTDEEWEWKKNRMDEAASNSKLAETEAETAMGNLETTTKAILNSKFEDHERHEQNQHDVRVELIDAAKAEAKGEVNGLRSNFTDHDTEYEAGLAHAKSVEKATRNNWHDFHLELNDLINDIVERQEALGSIPTAQLGYIQGNTTELDQLIANLGSNWEGGKFPDGTTYEAGITGAEAVAGRAIKDAEEQTQLDATALEDRGWSVMESKSRMWDRNRKGAVSAADFLFMSIERALYQATRTNTDTLSNEKVEFNTEMTSVNNGITSSDNDIVNADNQVVTFGEAEENQTERIDEKDSKWDNIFDAIDEVNETMRSNIDAFYDQTSEADVGPIGFENYVEGSLGQDMVQERDKVKSELTNLVEGSNGILSDVEKDFYDYTEDWNKKLAGYEDQVNDLSLDDTNLWQYYRKYAEAEYDEGLKDAKTVEDHESEVKGHEKTVLALGREVASEKTKYMEKYQDEKDDLLEIIKQAGDTAEDKIDQELATETQTLKDEQTKILDKMGSGKKDYTIEADNEQTDNVIDEAIKVADNLDEAFTAVNITYYEVYEAYDLLFKTHTRLDDALKFFGCYEPGPYNCEGDECLCAHILTHGFLHNFSQELEELGNETSANADSEFEWMTGNITNDISDEAIKWELMKNESSAYLNGYMNMLMQIANGQATDWHLWENKTLEEQMSFLKAVNENSENAQGLSGELDAVDAAATDDLNNANKDEEHADKESERLQSNVVNDASSKIDQEIYEEGENATNALLVHTQSTTDSAATTIATAGQTGAQGLETQNSENDAAITSETAELGEFVEEGANAVDGLKAVANANYSTMNNVYYSETASSSIDHVAQQLAQNVSTTFHSVEGEQKTAFNSARKQELEAYRAFDLTEDVDNEKALIEEDEKQSKKAIAEEEVDTNTFVLRLRDEVLSVDGISKKEKGEVMALAEQFLEDWEGESEHVTDKFENVRAWLAKDVHLAVQNDMVAKEQVQALLSSLGRKEAQIGGDLSEVEYELLRHLAALNYSHAFADLEAQLDLLVRENATLAAGLENRVDAIENLFSQFNFSLEEHIAESEDAFDPVDDKLREMNISAKNLLDAKDREIDQLSLSADDRVNALRAAATNLSIWVNDSEARLIDRLIEHENKSAHSGLPGISEFLSRFSENATFNDMIHHTIALIDETNTTMNNVKYIIGAFDQVNPNGIKERIDLWRNGINEIMGTLGENISTPTIDELGPHDGVEAQFMDEGNMIANFIRMKARMREEQMRSAGKSLGAVLHKMTQFRETEKYSMEKELKRVGAVATADTSEITQTADLISGLINETQRDAEQYHAQVTHMKERVYRILEASGYDASEAEAILKKLVFDNNMVAIKKALFASGATSLLEIARLPPVKAAARFRRAAAVIKQRNTTDDALEADLAIVAHA